MDKKGYNRLINQKESAMRTLKLSSPIVSMMLIFSMLFLVGPVNTAHAQMISTQSAVASSQAEAARADISAFFAREDVKQQLTDLGIAPSEAEARALNLSDAEAVSFADKLKDAPAGGDGIGVIVGAALFVFVVLLITDILGFTKVFKFTKAVR